MRAIPDRLLPHAVTREPWSTADDYGTPAYGAAQSLRCRVEFKGRMIANDRGQVTLSRGLVITGEPVVIDTRDRLTLPDGSQPPLLEVSVMSDGDGKPHHTEVVFG